MQGWKENGLWILVAGVSLVFIAGAAIVGKWMDIEKMRVEQQTAAQQVLSQDEAQGLRNEMRELKELLRADKCQN